MHKIDKQLVVDQNLDVLRTFAVLAVVATHLGANMFQFENKGFGFAAALGEGGVLIFFVHTSTVLLRSLDRTKSSQPFRNFYMRRAFRIYPLSVVAILLMLTFHIPDMPLHQFQWVGIREVIANFALTQNVTRGHPILGPLWSLPWEVQMYVLLPLISLVLKYKSSVRFAVGIWAVLVGLRCILELAHLSTTGYYLEFVPCFFGGVVAYQASKTWTARIPASAWPLAIAGLISVHCWLWTSVIQVKGIPIRRLESYFLCLGIGAAFAWCRKLPLSWFTRICHVVAKYSYGIYLLHIPIMWLAFVKLRHLPLPAQLTIFIFLMLLAPWAAFHSIENPFIEVGRRLASRNLSASTRPNYHQVAAG